MFPFTFKRKALCWCITLNSCCLLFLLGCFIKPTKACQDKQSGAYRNRCTVSASCLDRPAVFCSQNSVLHCRNLLQSSVRVCFFLSPGSRRGCPLWSVWVSDAGWCLPQALDRTAWEHPHVFSPEAVSKRDCPATDAQVQTLQMTSPPNTAASLRHSPSGHSFLF